MCECLSNYGVCLLILAMLTKSWQVIWKDNGQLTAIRNGDEFLDWMKYFLSQRTDKVNEQIANSGEILAGGVPVEALNDCHSALQRGTAFPPYNFNDWNSLPLEVDHHPLLAPGPQKATFRKKATPFPDQASPLGLEVMFLPLNQAAFDLWQACKQASSIE